MSQILSDDDAVHDVSSTVRSGAPLSEWWLKPLELPRLDDSGWDRNNVGQFITIVSARTIKLECDYVEHSGSDGVIWNRGFSEGKHVFAIMWPRDQRVIYGSQVIFGIGYSMDMHKDSLSPLIGSNKASVGLDLVENSLVFNGSQIGTYPRNKPRNFVIPTLLYAYIDFDRDHIAFGTSWDDFWGIALSFQEIRKSHSRSDLLFPMVAFRKIRGKFSMFYKGHGESNCMIQS